MADAAAVNAVMQRVLAVTLDKGSAAAGQDPPVLFLEGLAQVRFETLLEFPTPGDLMHSGQHASMHT
jgi:hypothetical protein